MGEHLLKSPFINVELDSRPPDGVVLMWIVFWIAFSLIGIYGYVFWLPEQIGFQKTALSGVALVILLQNKPTI
jgi:hypothetical protein